MADLQRAGRAAIDLTGDPAILTAIANDVGVEAIFARQVIAYGRPGDALVALSTSGGSGNVIAALAEARRRGLVTIALVGYDGGTIAAERTGRPRRDHPLAAHPADPGGAGQRLPRPLRARGMKEVIHAKLRGVIGAMAMTGVRVFAVHAGPHPRGPAVAAGAQARRGARARWKVELVHWAMGGALRDRLRAAARDIRRRAWSGPVYGLLVWLGFDAVVAPALGLTERDWPKGRERAVFVADHLLFGFVLNEMRERPRE